MKKLLSFALIIVLVSCSSDDNETGNQQPPARTTISDANFEQALIDLGFDNTLDGSVLTSSIQLVSDLVIDNKGISNLNGLQDFTNITNLSANGNSLSSVNVSSNTQLKFIFLDDNNLSGINVQNLPDLEKVSVSNNNISTIDVSTIITLQQLIVDGNNLMQLDVSTNPNLNILDSRDNNISCIRVSGDQFANIPSGWNKDDTTTYGITCN